MQITNFLRPKNLVLHLRSLYLGCSEETTGVIIQHKEINVNGELIFPDDGN